MSEKSSLRRLMPSGVLGAYVIILVTRARESLGRFPGDPGYEYLLDGADFGPRSIFFGDPYFHVMARFVALIAELFPIGMEAIVASSLVHLIWALSGVAIASVVELETTSWALGAFAGLLLITAPHAAESSLGNIGNVKWPISTALIVMCCSANTLRTRLLPVMIVGILVGMTQPLAILGAIPVTFYALRGVVPKKNALLLLGVLFATTTAQLAKIGFGDATSGRSEKVVSPWDGMGLFWWSGLIGPLFISVAIIILLSVLAYQNRIVSRFSLLLAVLSIAFSLSTYQLGGIADRYFTLPMTLCLLGLFSALYEMAPKHLGRNRLAAAAVAVLLLIPTTKWFFVNPYLASGPSWSFEVQRARKACEVLPTKEIELELSSGGSVTMFCSRLVND